MPRVALLATLCEHPAAVTPTREWVDDLERRHAAMRIPHADEAFDEVAQRIEAAGFDSLRKRLR
jgi:hypothetical protein